MKVSILIPFRRGDLVQERNLEWLLARYRAFFPDYEIIVEEDEPGSPPFAKAASLNRAFRRSSGDIILQSDAEVFCKPEQIRQAVEGCKKAGWALTYERVYKLNPAISQRIVQGSVEADPPELALGDILDSREARKAKTWWGFLVAVRQDVWPGFDERFVGWGYEDVAFRFTLETLCGPPHWVKGNLYHLWHSLISREESQNSGQLAHNTRLFVRYRKALGDKVAMAKLQRRGQWRV